VLTAAAAELPRDDREWQDQEGGEQLESGELARLVEQTEAAFATYEEEALLAEEIVHEVLEERDQFYFHMVSDPVGNYDSSYSGGSY
jgi:hypothetical protein